MSASTNCHWVPWFCRSHFMFSLEPTRLRLSNTATSQPDLRRASARLLPMKPQPPVTSHFIVFQGQIRESIRLTHALRTIQAFSSILVAESRPDATPKVHTWRRYRPRLPLRICDSLPR